MELLPDDMIAGVLGRLHAPSSLATARCICKRWRSIIDGRLQLRAGTHLPLPLHLDGVLIHSHHADEGHYPRPFFFGRPRTVLWMGSHLEMCFSPELDDYGHYGVPDRQVMDHCNGEEPS